MIKKESQYLRLLPWLFGLIAIAALVVFVFIPIYSEKEVVNERPPEVFYYEGDSQPLTMENDQLLFEMDQSTTQFTVTNKANGQVWRSNPEDASSDPLAKGTNKDMLSSTLLVTYTTDDGMVDYNNYTYSIANSNYRIEPQSDGSIRVEYVIGKIEKTFLIPQAITKERYDALTDKMSKSTKKKLASNYTLSTPDKLDSKDNKDELIAMYPSITEESLYILKDGTSETNKSKIEGYFNEAGYTQEDYEIDMQLVASTTETAGPVFNVTMDYRLEGEDLVVSIPYSNLRYRSQYPITYVSPLPMFGAGSTDDKGYLVVPEGGGAIINFNNGKLSQNLYYANMYGWDYGSERKEAVSETENAFPVFGISREGEGSFISIMEGASAYGGVNADIALRYNSYNYVYGKYNVLHYDQYNVSAKTARLVYMYEAAVPDDTIVQRYRFLESDSYVDMANAYGNYLRSSNKALAESKSSEAMPVNVELLGAIDKIVPKMGIPVKSVIKTTSFDEAKEIIADLTDAQVQNLSIRMSGWSNGGVKQKVLTGVNILQELGGAHSMDALISYAREQNVRLYFDGITCFAYDSGILQGFTAFNDAARFTTREQIKLYDYSIITYQQMKGEDPYYLVKPQYARNNASNLIRALKDRKAYGIAFRDIGDLLSGDYNPRSTVTREETKKMNVETLEEADAAGLKIMIRKGNDYALPAADIITDMNLSGNRYAILDAEIPFYQIALHGMKDFTGDPINLSADSHEQLLLSAAYGAGLNFTFMKADGKVLQETDYTSYYSANYAVWRDRALEMIRRYQDDMAGLNQQRITGHERISADVTVTTYENGTKVYVNFGNTAYDFDGLQIPARDYLVKGGDVK